MKEAVGTWKLVEGRLLLVVVRRLPRSSRRPEAQTLERHDTQQIGCASVFVSGGPGLRHRVSHV